MAKLNGVTTVIPAQAERIMYDGVEYVKSDEAPLAGDIVRYETSEYRFVAEGGYYAILEDEGGDVLFLDEDGDECTVDDGDDITVFKRVEPIVETAAQPAATPDVVVHNGVKYRKTLRNVTKGDRYIMALTDRWDITKGRVYEIERIDSDGDPRFLDNAGDGHYLPEGLYAVLEPLSNVEETEEIVVHKGVRYRKVARKAKEGELAVITGNTVRHKFPIGEIVRAGERCSDSGTHAYYLDGRDWWAVADENYAVLEPLETTEVPAPAPTEAPAKLPDQYVIHDGRVYVKEQRKARAGELVLITKQRLHFIRVGEIVPCVGYATFSAKAAQFVDGKGEDNTQGIGPDEYSVLVPATSITVDGVEYAIEQRQAAVGERVLVVNLQCAIDYEIGDIYEVSPGGSSSNCVRITDRVGDTNALRHAEYVVLTPKAAVKTAPQTTQKYREVKRPANVGERIRIVAAHEAHGKYQDGDEFVAEERSAVGGVYVSAVSTVGNRNGLIADDEYVILEPEEAALKVGDYAKVTRDIYEYKTGDIVKLMSLVGRPGSMFDFSIKNLRTGGNGYVENSFIVRATDEEVAAAKRDQTDKQAQPERLKVGEYVRVIAVKNGHSAEIGDVVKIIEDDRSPLPFRCENVDGSELKAPWFDETELERVSAADVEKAQATAKETAKWAMIGRKVGEIKAGDIVRTTGSCGGHPVGTIGVVVRDETFRNLRVLANGVVKSHHGQLELVAPAESVVNIDASMADTDSYYAA